ncbi:hypothetical protein ES703_56837 [subsurface metagenome]
MGDKQCIHYWIVDNKDVGRCQYCGAMEDFGALMRRGAGLKTVSLTKSAAANKRWSDPEYREKQIAVRKKRRQEHRAKQNALLVQANVTQLRPRQKYRRHLQGGTIKGG